jgi:hypothetical protein
MYNLRYHLASLIAVFLALVAGLVLGSVAAEFGYLDEQQAALIQDLQEEFDELRHANDDLRDQYERDHGFAVQVADAYTQGLLADRRVLVIADDALTDALGVVNRAVVGAGGRVVTAFLAEPGFGLYDADLRADLALLGQTDVPVHERDLEREIAAGLAAELRSPVGVETPYMDALTDAGILELDGWEPGRRIDGAVVVASFEEQADTASIRFGARLHDMGLPVAGAESSYADNGVVSAALEAGLSAVDHADLPQGALSLTMILAGRAEGHYGLRDGASGASPPLGVPED